MKHTLMDKVSYLTIKLCSPTQETKIAFLAIMYLQKECPIVLSLQGDMVS